MSPRLILAAFSALGIKRPVAEYRFAPPRRFRFDYAWPEEKVALEVQGGLFIAGRHVRGAALMREHEKLNEAAARGWRVLYTQPRHVLKQETLRFIRRCLYCPL